MILDIAGEICVYIEESVENTNIKVLRAKFKEYAKSLNYNHGYLILCFN